jgi:hypothetical protein
VSVLRTMKALQRFASITWRVIRLSLFYMLAFMLGASALIAVGNLLIRFVEPDHDAADALLMGGIMWTSMVLCVLGPIALLAYVILRIKKWLAGSREHNRGTP